MAPIAGEYQRLAGRCGALAMPHRLRSPICEPTPAGQKRRCDPFGVVDLPIPRTPGALRDLMGPMAATPGVETKRDPAPERGALLILYPSPG